MGTWICHLRVAELLLGKLPLLNEEAFIIGSLSPDSGYPNEDWTEFDPPKAVTHFIHKGETEANTRDYLFYRQYLIQPIEDNQAFSFRLAYFFHLVCDYLWAKRVGKTTRAENQILLDEKGLYSLIEVAKADWYGLDHLYIRNHPDMHAWQVFLHAKNPPSYLDFIPLQALHHQLDYIRDYYSHPDPTRVLDRPFPYLNETSMAKFVQDCASASIEIYRLMQGNPLPSPNETSLELLEPAWYAPYPPPLGDQTNL